MAQPEDSTRIGKYSYIVKADHRDGSRIKSQWTIPVDKERASFAFGIDSGWVLDKRAWGLHLIDGVANYLGRSAVDPGPSVDLCVAFFQIEEPCHGYPSEPKRSTREIPPEKVKNDWLSKGYLRASVVRKIGRGLTCRL